MSKIAFLFPGQGSQSVGMGHDFYQEFDIVRELFDMAEELTKIHLSRLCFKGPMEDLTETVNLQPAVTTVNLAALAAIEKEGLGPHISAGHSLGEYSALTAAGVLSREDTIRLVHQRGILMHREATQHEGAMHAIVGLPIETVDTLCNQNQDQGVVSVANHNMETQIVISGEPAAVEAVSRQAADQGARAVPLKVSGAWHSELIRGAESDFRDYLEGVEFKDPTSPVLHNVTAREGDDPGQIRILMADQLCSPVRWFDSMRRLIDEKVDTFVEVGPGRVLAGLLRKIVPSDYDCRSFNVNSMKTFEKFMNSVG